MGQQHSAITIVPSLCHRPPPLFKPPESCCSCAPAAESLLSGSIPTSICSCKHHNLHTVLHAPGLQRPPGRFQAHPA